MMPIDQTVRNIIAKLLNGEDYQSDILDELNTEYRNYVIGTYRKVAHAKMNKQAITLDWYKDTFLSNDLPTTNIEMELETSSTQYDKLCALIDPHIDYDAELDMILNIMIRQVSIKFNINEILIVLNSIALKRAALRDEFWSKAGKRVEKPLMRTLCELYSVPPQHYRQPDIKAVDFYLVGQDGEEYKCEVKLMGKGNPESADAVIARGSHVFVADKLSDLNKDQLDGLGVHWVELRQHEGYKRFQLVLEGLDIPHAVPDEDLSTVLSKILDMIL